MSQFGVEQLRSEGQETNEKAKGREKQIQVQYNKIRGAKYNVRYKQIRTNIRARYLEKTRDGNNQQLTARARCGNIKRWNSFWLWALGRKEVRDLP